MEKIKEEIRNTLKTLSREEIESHCFDFYGIEETDQENHDLGGRKELEEHFMWSIDLNTGEEEKIRFLLTILDDLKNGTRNYRKFYANKGDIN